MGANNSIKSLGAAHGGKKDAPELWPEELTIVGHDISVAELCKLYKSDEAIAAVIREAMDPRANDPLVPRFVRSLRGGVITPINVCNLGPDKNGKSWIIVTEGRQRVKGLRVINEEREKTGNNKLTLLGVLRKCQLRPGWAREIKAKGNVRNDLNVMDQATLAIEFKEAGMALDDIAETMGLEEARHVKELILLCDLIPSGQKALREGKLKAYIARTIARKPPEEQQGALDAVLNKSGRTALRTLQSDDKQPRMVQKRTLAKVVGHMPPKSPDTALLRYVLGDEGALEECSTAVKEAFSRAKASIYPDAEGEGDGKNKNKSKRGKASSAA